MVKQKELLPLPPNNADGSDLAVGDQPINAVVWPNEEVRFFGDDEEQNDGEYDGFVMGDLNETQFSNLMSIFVIQETLALLQRIGIPAGLVANQD